MRTLARIGLARIGLAMAFATAASASFTSAASATRSGAGGQAPPITALAFSRDGSQLIVGSQAGLEARDWPELATRRKLETGLAHVHDLAFSPDGTRLAVAGGVPSEAGTLEVRTWPSGDLVFANTSRDDLIYGVAWRPDGKQLACPGHDGRVSLHESRLGSREALLEGHSRPVLCALYTADSQTLVTTGVDHSLRVWRAKTGERHRVLENHTEAVRDLALRPQARGAMPMVASVSDDNTLRLWQPTIGRLVRFCRLPARPLAVEWTTDGALLLVACTDGSLRVVDPDSVEVIETHAAIEGWAYCLAVRPGPAGEQLVVVAGENAQITTLRIAPVQAPGHARGAR